MDDIKSNLQEIKEYTMDRLKMPIFFYYFVILIVWNWDIILLIWKSTYPIECVIGTIQKNGFVMSRYLCPLIIAIVGNFIFPFIMYLIELSLSEITKQRNETALGIELKKAEKEYKVLEVKTGIKTITELEQQKNKLETERDTLKNDVTSLKEDIKTTKTSLETANNKIPELESSLKKEQLEKEQLKQDVIHFESHVGYYDLHEEVESFKEKIIILHSENHSENRVLDLLKKIYNEENSPLLMAISSNDLFHDFKRLKFLEEYQSGQVERVKLTPYGIKFMYWLYGSESPNKSMDVALNKDTREIFKILKEKNLLDHFKKFAFEINNKNRFTIDESFETLVKLNLIEEPKFTGKPYKLTALGDHLYSLILTEILE